MAARAPSYSDRKGWTGGDSRTLYAITDRRTMRVTVLPGGSMQGVGPEADIRVATRAEAEEHWQNPLHEGWRVDAGRSNPDRELELYIDNDSELYEKGTKPIYAKLADAKLAGNYSRAVAVREFRALADTGAEKYQREIERRRFSDTEKREYAESAADYFEAEWKLGNMRDYASGAAKWNPTNNPWEVRSSDGGLEGAFAQEDDAKFYADELRRIGARGVQVSKRTRRTPPYDKRNPPNVLPVPGQQIRSWDHGDGTLVKICEESNDGSLLATIKLATGRTVAVPLTRTEYDLAPRKLVERRTGFSRHEQFIGPPQPDRMPRGTPTEFDDTETVREEMTRPHRSVQGRVNPEAKHDSDILDGMARAIWVTSWADWVDELSKEERKEHGVPVSFSERDIAEEAPETPPSAVLAAEDLYLMIERANGKSPGELFEEACRVDGCKRSDANAELFGHSLAMQGMGHGVSWFDDHKEFPLKFPQFFEAHYMDGEIWWSPQIMSRMNPCGGSRS